MKKVRNILLALCILLVAALAAVSLLGGKTNALHREVGDSEQYTPTDIRRAMRAVEWRFRLGFRGCSLLELTYDEEYSAARSDGWAAQYGEEEAIVLTSSFEVGDSDGSLNPNSIYRNYQWILTRSGGGGWTLQTWGYG